MSLRRRFRATIEFEGYDNDELHAAGLPSLDERIRECIETHPVASFKLDSVHVVELSADCENPPAVSYQELKKFAETGVGAAILADKQRHVCVNLRILTTSEVADDAAQLGAHLPPDAEACAADALEAALDQIPTTPEEVERFERENHDCGIGTDGLAETLPEALQIPAEVLHRKLTETLATTITEAVIVGARNGCSARELVQTVIDLLEMYEDKNSDE